MMGWVGLPGSQGRKLPRVLRVGQQKQEEMGRPTGWQEPCWACCPSSSLKPCSLLPSRALECVSPISSTRPQPAGNIVHAVFTRILVCAEGLHSRDSGIFTSQSSSSSACPASELCLCGASPPAPCPLGLILSLGFASCGEQQTHLCRAACGS